MKTFNIDLFITNHVEPAKPFKIQISGQVERDGSYELQRIQTDIKSSDIHKICTMLQETDEAIKQHAQYLYKHD